MTGVCSVAGCARPARYVARQLCSPHYARWLRHGDVQADKPVQPAVPERTIPIDVDELLRLRGAGWTVADLADRYRCTRRTVNRRIAAAGAATPARPVTPAELARIRALADAGVPGAEIARTVGRARETIYHHAPHAIRLTPSETAIIRHANAALRKAHR